MTIGSNFFVEADFCIEVFQSKVFFEAGLKLESVKKFRSGSEVKTLATAQRSHSKTFQVKV